MHTFTLQTLICDVHAMTSDHHKWTQVTDHICHFMGTVHRDVFILLFFWSPLWFTSGWQTAAGESVDFGHSWTSVPQPLHFCYLHCQPPALQQTKNEHPLYEKVLRLPRLEFLTIQMRNNFLEKIRTYKWQSKTFFCFFYVGASRDTRELHWTDSKSCPICPCPHSFDSTTTYRGERRGNLLPLLT